jgi:hypothetical protein
VREVRRAGAVASPDVLLRALEARPDLFRLLDPWRGAWRHALPRRGAEDSGGIGVRWVVGIRASQAREGLAARLRASLSQLALTVDERSVTDLARWMGMMREGERLLSGGLRTPGAPGA